MVGLPRRRRPSSPTSSQLEAVAIAENDASDAVATHAMAEAVLRVGLVVITVVAATDCVFALVAGAGLLAAGEGVVLTCLGLAAVVRIDVTARVLRPKGRVVLIASLFAAGGVLDVGVQVHFAEVGAAIVLIAALICSARVVALCFAVSAAGFLAALAVHGNSVQWMVGDGRYTVAGQLVNLAANGAAGLLMIALLRAFLASAPEKLDAVSSGGASLTPQLALAASGGHMRLLAAADPQTLIATLTDAERAVVRLLADGRVPKQAAGDLSIALPTVRSRIAAAKRKTGARTLEQLVAMYAKAEVA